MSMTREGIRTAVLAALAGIAPEIDAGSTRPGERLRDQFDLDSMDYLNFVLALSHDTGVEIPEADYPKISTLDSCVEYLAARLGGKADGGGGA